MERDATRCRCDCAELVPGVSSVLSKKYFCSHDLHPRISNHMDQNGHNFKGVPIATLAIGTQTTLGISHGFIQWLIPRVVCAVFHVVKGFLQIARNFGIQLAFVESVGSFCRTKTIGGLLYKGTVLLLLPRFLNRTPLSVSYTRAVDALSLRLVLALMADENMPQVAFTSLA